MGRRGYPPEFRRKVLEATRCCVWPSEAGVLTNLLTTPLIAPQL